MRGFFRRSEAWLLRADRTALGAQAGWPLRVGLTRSSAHIPVAGIGATLSFAMGFSEGRQSLPAAVIPFAGRTVGYGSACELPIDHDGVAEAGSIRNRTFS
jgi:hypothetical protein